MVFWPRLQNEHILLFTLVSNGMLESSEPRLELLDCEMNEPDMIVKSTLVGSTPVE